MDSFLASPTVDGLLALKKSELLKLAQKLELSEAKRQMRKAEIAEIIATYYVDEKVFAENDLDKFTLPEVKPDQNALETMKLQLELKRLDMEEKEKQRKLELEEREKQRKLELEEKEKQRQFDLEREEKQRRFDLEEREKQRQFDLEEKEKQRQLELKKLEAEEKQRQFDLEREEKQRKLELEEKEKQRQIDLEEKEKQRQIELRKLEIEEKRLAAEDKYRNRFDVSRQIPLVPPFSEVEVDRYFSNFEDVARSYEWPEEYWARMLRSVLKGKALVACSTLSPTDKDDYDKVKKAILHTYELVPEAYRQKFRNLRKTDSQTHIQFAQDKNERFERWCVSAEATDYDSLKQLILVEEFKNCINGDIRTFLAEKQVDTLEEAAKLADDYALNHKTNFSKPSGGSFPSKGSSGAPKHFEKKKPGDSHVGGSEKSSLFCKYCRRAGHAIADCYRLKNRQGAKPNGFVTSRRRMTNPHAPVCSPRPSEVKKTFMSDDVREEFLPFVSEGFVSLTENSSPVPIRILRDTGASQSLLLEGALPFCDETATGEYTLIQGIEEKVESVPLHFVQLTSDLVTGRVKVGIRPRLPFKGVSLLLGNDLAGGKVVPSVCLSAKPSTEKVVEDTDLFPSCAVTRAMAKRVEEGDPPPESTPLQDRDDVSHPDLHAGDKTSSCYDGLSDTLLTTPLIPDSPSSGAPTAKREVGDTLLQDRGDVSHPGLHAGDDASSCYDGLSDTFLATLFNQDSTSSDAPTSKSEGGDTGNLSLSLQRLIQEQCNDSELSELRDKALSEDEITKVPVGYYLNDGLLMRKWRPPDRPASEDWAVVHQVVVPKAYRDEILAMAHSLPLGGHLGVNKTVDKILKQFFWPGLRRDVVSFCRTCHTCQVVGKYQSDPPVSPLRPIPAIDEPFSRVIIDCVGPLPKARSGNQYLLTIMCAATRFPEAIPLRNIKAPTISKALIKFFTHYGLPKEIQSDQGSNFTSGLFRQVVKELGIKQITSSAYHPESQGALERFHSTLKTMMRAFCLENEKDWDEGVHLLLFAVRESVQESTGFSPFELVFGHQVRGPLALLSEQWTNKDTHVSLLDYVVKFKERLHRACSLAKENLEAAQSKMKTWYDRKSRTRTFKPGDQVLVLFPIQANPLRARFHGPYEIHSQIDSLNYLVKTPDRKKSKQLCHINMLKPYYNRSANVVAAVREQEERNHAEEQATVVDEPLIKLEVVSCKLTNSQILNDLESKLSHLKPDQQLQMKQLILKYEKLFPDVPKRTTVAVHDVDVGDAKPIKQHPYRMNPDKCRLADEEIAYMLENGIIRRSSSNWSSPCVLVPKPDGSTRFCTDYRKVNNVSKTDAFPIPRIDDCIDKVGGAEFLTKIDLLKGYWCVPLTERAREISAFVTPSGLYEYNVLPFGMKNAPATFQRMIHSVTQDLTHTQSYIDDLVTGNDNWEDHLISLEKLFQRLSNANLTVNLSKSEFGQANVTYLGHVIGQGRVAPVNAKIQSIVNFPIPTNKKALRRFLGMVGYYRKFCKNFADITSPLTNLLKKNVSFLWTDVCQKAFISLKDVLCHHPVLKSPDFDRPFSLAVDASDEAAGAVLLQHDKDNIEHPVAYFSKKFNKHQLNYSTIEKELLALVLALQHFEVYVCAGQNPLVVHTDHNPLVFLSKMKNKNRRLLNWSLMLQEYDLVIKHIKGKDNVIADCLSRC